MMRMCGGRKSVVCEWNEGERGEGAKICILFFFPQSSCRNPRSWPWSIAIGWRKFFFFFSCDALHPSASFFFFCMMHAQSLLGVAVFKATSTGRELGTLTVLFSCGTTPCWLTYHSLNGWQLCSAHVVLVRTRLEWRYIPIMTKLFLVVSFISSVKLQENGTYLLSVIRRYPPLGSLKKMGDIVDINQVVIVDGERNSETKMGNLYSGCLSGEIDQTDAPTRDRDR